MSIITRIIDLAKKRGLKQSYICEQLGLERTWLQTVKKQNSNISPERLERIAEILNTTTAYLKGETDTPEKEKSPSEVDELLNDPLNKELWDRLAKMSRAKKTALLALIQDQESN